MRPNQSAQVSRPRILVVGQAVKPTGYARIFHSVIRHVKESFEIVHFGVNYKGAPLDCGWRIEPNHLTGDILGAAQLPALLEKLHPDLVFMSHDYWFYGAHRRALRRCQRPPIVVYYCPIEWPSYHIDTMAELAEVDKLVAYTEFGRGVIESALAAARRAGKQLAPRTIEVIPLGVDTATFRPLCGDPSPQNLSRSRRQAREQLFPRRPELLDGFIVLNANRNCARKRIDLTLRSFAEFIRGKPDNLWLYLHMGLKDHGVDILELADRVGVKDRLLVTTTSADKPDVPDEVLNLIYNACDVGLNTATGEGWGLVAFEHAATGAAQILPAHDTLIELWRGAGLFSQVNDCPQAPSGCGVVSIDETVAQLNRVYYDRNLLHRQSELVFERATSPRFCWRNIAGRWESLFQELLDTPG